MDSIMIGVIGKAKAEQNALWGKFVDMAASVPPLKVPAEVGKWGGYLIEQLKSAGKDALKDLPQHITGSSHLRWGRGDTPVCLS